MILFLYCSPKNKELSWNVEVDTIEDSQWLLKDQMPDSLYTSIQGRKVKQRQRQIKNEKEAIEIGRSIFAESFGSEYHYDERRYLAHLAHGYWVIKGLQPKGFMGGTLVTVVDSQTGEIFKTLVWK